MAKKHCSECGAELQPGPASCPLCGTTADAPPRRPTADWSRAKVQTTKDVKTYQDDIRSLREELKRLRDESAEAV
ncbi:MAG: hypothetical protein M3290_04790 [Actinomycetota bacterium]|nr:hypothetical protein [Actinomycetota bacterium]